jgi:hypothetical protein
MKTLKIKWQRLVFQGEQCTRCSSTEKEVEKAFQSLKQSLAPLGTSVVLEKKELSLETYKKDVLESNRIWIGERPLEEWLNAQVGQSLCRGPCCNNQIRTLEMEEKIYENITAEIIVEAGFIAASRLFSLNTKSQGHLKCKEKDKGTGLHS